MTKFIYVGRSRI